MLSDNMLILMFILMIGMNILISYIYRENNLFPIIFILFELIFAISIISLNEIYVLYLLFFGIGYNLMNIIEKRNE